MNFSDKASHVTLLRQTVQEHTQLNRSKEVPSADWWWSKLRRTVYCLRDSVMKLITGKWSNRNQPKIRRVRPWVLQNSNVELQVQTKYCAVKADQKRHSLKNKSLKKYYNQISVIKTLIQIIRASIIFVTSTLDTIKFNNVCSFELFNLLYVLERERILCKFLYNFVFGNLCKAFTFTVIIFINAYVFQRNGRW